MQELSVENYLTHHYPTVENLPAMAKKLLFFTAKSLFHENQINTFLADNAHKDTFSFVESVVDYFDVGIKMNKKHMDRIPAYGRVVIIANHPLGALDAMALIHLLKDVRKDIKIVANAFLGQFENLQELVIPVDNITGKMTKATLEGIYEALDKEEAVIIFPSGEVSRARPNGVRDTAWKSGFYKIASKTHSPILPIYIDAKNSKSFYLLSMLNRSLATATLPHEMFKAKGKEIEFTIGNPISYEGYAMPKLPQKEAVKLLRKHFYRVAKGKKHILKVQKGISLAEAPIDIKTELKEGKVLGETSDGKKIILYESVVENCVIKEIGRLREISFRHVGEGSGEKRDIDSYDFYYKHLIIWDEESLEIAGAYRIGECREIVDDFGIEGLYTSTLFKFSDTFEPYFEQALELGRSFVQPKYWNSRALDYLWQGIGAYVKAHPNIRYLFGPVSLSDSFTLQAKSLLIYFYSHYFGTKEQIVRHKVRYKMPKEMKNYCEDIFCGHDYRADQRVLKEELGYMGYTIPTLYKQYAEVCEEGGVQFMDFGYDKQFNYCIDGFILVDLHLMKESKRKRYIG
ncbi:lysophospholipid acyltransferase family protein [Sulfurovum sp.]|uniref:lysophospholipid acyltransferase family protein n=1 Tax=Sulfurovum sp. TaxID=1969726 RepID=UPI0025F64F40|nr:lysophospholipid acyltransferase family protein [Sulfurovum sp.]